MVLCSEVGCGQGALSRLEPAGFGVVNCMFAFWLLSKSFIMDDPLSIISRQKTPQKLLFLFVFYEAKQASIII